MTDPEKQSNEEDARLAPYFEAARGADRDPLDDLMARITADASRTAGELNRLQSAPPYSGVLSGLAAALGGWPAVSGLAAAGLAGVWIGISDPLGVDPFEIIDAYVIGADAFDPDADNLAWELSQ